MYTYLAINLGGALLCVILDLYVLRTRVLCTRPAWIIMGIMMLLTAIFDPWIATHPVGYNPELTTGVTWFGAPVEDFAYTFLGVTGVGMLLKRLGEN